MQCIYTILWGRRFVQPEAVDQREWWWNHYVVLSENHRSRLVSLVWFQWNNMNNWEFIVGDILLITFANALTLIRKLVINMQVVINGFLEISYSSVYVRLLSLGSAATPWTSKSGLLVGSGIETFVLLWLLGYSWISMFPRAYSGPSFCVLQMSGIISLRGYFLIRLSGTSSWREPFQKSLKVGTMRSWKYLLKRTRKFWGSCVFGLLIEAKHLREQVGIKTWWLTGMCTQEYPPNCDLFYSFYKDVVQSVVISGLQRDGSTSSPLIISDSAIGNATIITRPVCK